MITDDAEFCDADSEKSLALDSWSGNNRDTALQGLCWIMTNCRSKKECPQVGFKPFLKLQCYPNVSKYVSLSVHRYGLNDSGLEDFEN